MTAIQHGGEYSSIESSKNKAATPTNSTSYQTTQTDELTEQTNGAAASHELHIEDAIGTWCTKRHS